MKKLIAKKLELATLSHLPVVKGLIQQNFIIVSVGYKP